MAIKAGIFALVAAASLGSAALAQSTSDVSAESRFAWAKRHVELVCRPLEARQMFDKAARCYNDVARIVSEAAKAAPATKAAPRPASTPAAAPAYRQPVRVAARPARRVAAAPQPVARPFFAPVALIEPPATTSRCQGISCLQRYTLLGVGF